MKCSAIISQSRVATSNATGILEQATMVFGREYLMVYIPDFNPKWFLLSVHKPAGSTNLSDYSGGECRVVGQSSLQAGR